jgi:cytosine/adenosine deaminase-related metal-dependent hydrolase
MTFTDFQAQLQQNPDTIVIGNINTQRELIKAARDAKRYVYIGKTSEWGNPYQLSWDGDHEEIVAKYREWIKNQPQLLAKLPTLRGKVLGCYCAPRSCHGDVLAELATP